MPAKENFIQQEITSRLDDENHFLSEEEAITEINLEPVQNWTHAIDDQYIKDQLANNSGSWIIEDNKDALEEYMDDISEVILPGDIDSFDW